MYTGSRTYQCKPPLQRLLNIASHNTNNILNKIMDIIFYYKYQSIVSVKMTTCKLKLTIPHLAYKQLCNIISYRTVCILWRVIGTISEI